MFQTRVNQWLKRLKLQLTPIIASYDVLAIKKRMVEKETAYVIDMTPTFEVMYKLFQIL
jgi:hypothetical protein